MNNNKGKKYKQSSHYTLGRIAKEYGIRMNILMNWIFINEPLKNDLDRLLLNKDKRGQVLLPPTISERIFKIIDEEKK